MTTTPFTADDPTSAGANDPRRRRTAASAIALYARATLGYDGRVAHATAVLQSAALEHAGRIVQVTSLGAEGMVLTDLIARQQRGIPVATIDTGRLHPQTVALVPASLPTHAGSRRGSIGDHPLRVARWRRAGHGSGSAH